MCICADIFVKHMACIYNLRGIFVPCTYMIRIHEVDVAIGCALANICKIVGCIFLYCKGAVLSIIVIDNCGRYICSVLYVNNINCSL